jgi:hypothetical protein
MNAPHHPRPRPHLRRFTMWMLAAAALAATFYLYGRPGVVFDLATRIWSCI